MVPGQVEGVLSDGHVDDLEWKSNGGGRVSFLVQDEQVGRGGQVEESVDSTEHTRPTLHPVDRQRLGTDLHLLDGRGRTDQHLVFRREV